MLQSNPAMQSASSSAITTWLNSENSLFSSVLENAVSNRQVLLMGHACLAFSALVCAVPFSPKAIVLMLLWFFEALFICVKGGLK